MGLFATIMNKIFHHGAPAVGTAPSVSPTDPASSDPMNIMPATPGGTAATPTVDVGAVLSGMAAAKNGGGNYQSSIVDLLKLLDMDSSLSARKELANELGIHVGADGSAEENIALHKAVMAKLAENGGTIPANLRD